MLGAPEGGLTTAVCRGGATPEVEAEGLVEGAPVGGFCATLVGGAPPGLGCDTCQPALFMHSLNRAPTVAESLLASGATTEASARHAFC